MNSKTHDPVKLLEKLVSFDTVSSNSNVALIEWAADLLDTAGFRTQVQRTDDNKYANLYASVGPEDVPGVILSGHSDVVPVEGQPWTTDPFKLTPQGDRLLARGSADMKGFIGCVLAQSPTFAAQTLKQPIHVALTHNEETDMSGMQQLKSLIEQTGAKPAACIIGEPTMMQVVVANKGAAIWRVKVRGHPVHSSLRDQGVSAVEIAAEMISFLNGMQLELNTAQRHDGFDFPFTSIHSGMIHGGMAHNITAQDCEFMFEIRALPGVQANDILAKLQTHCDQKLLPAMKAISPDCAIQIKEVVNSPGLNDVGNKNLAQAIMPLCNCLEVTRVSFGTEAGWVTESGVPTVVCGPGDINVAHQPDEYVEVDQLNQCMTFLEKVGQRAVQEPLS